MYDIKQKEKNMNKKFSLVQKLFLSISTFMLVFFTLIPSNVFAITYTTSAVESSLEVSVSNVNEAVIRTNSSATITFKLTEAKWASSFTNEKKRLLIDSFVAINEVNQWETLRRSLSEDNITKNNDTELTITLPNNPNYSLTENQTISLTVPQQLLEDDKKLPTITFEITAATKALISGTATPTLSQDNFLKGGKTIEVSLVNTTWVPTVASNTTQREKLLDWFNWTDLGVNKELIKARAKVVRSADGKVVTITLPEMNTFKVNSGDLTFKMEDDSITINPILIRDSKVVSTILAPAQSVAKVSGISEVSEYEIAISGKQFTLTLTNDQWVGNVASFKDNLIVRTDTSKERLPVTKIERKSDKEILITLGAYTTDITVHTIVEIFIPSNLLIISSVELEIPSAFIIVPVSASLSGTATPTLDPADVVKGKKTIVIELENAEFDTSKSLSNYKNMLNNYPEITNSIQDANIKVTKTRVTFTLPAVPNFVSSAGRKISVSIPPELVVGAKILQNVGEISIGQTGTASLNTFTIKDSEIISGGRTLTITLNGADWDPTISTNKSKQTALLKGFVTTEQTKEWAKVTSAFKNAGTFVLNGKQLSIVFPSVGDYSIIRNQDLTITIPKTVLFNSKADIAVFGKLSITVPGTPNTLISFDELLEEDLTEDVIKNTRMIVPKKQVQNIYINTVEVPSSAGGSNSLTTIEVTTNSSVKRVQVTIGEETKDVNGSNKAIFIFKNIPKDSEMIVKAFANVNDTMPMEAPVYKKIGKGSKTYNELPKKDLSGSYSLYQLLTDKSLLKDILKYYSINDLMVGS